MASEPTQLKPKDLSKSQERRRKDIVNAALKLFDRDGFEATKMADIAKEAEVAKGTLYLYFENKSALLEGVITTVILPTLQSIGVAATEHSGTAKELLSIQLRIVAKRMSSPQMKALLRHMISGGQTHQKIIQFYYDNVIQNGLKLFSDTIALGVKSGEFKKEVAEIDPVVLVGANVYLAIWNILFTDMSPIDTEKLTDDLLELFLNGLLVNE